MVVGAMVIVGMAVTSPPTAAAAAAVSGTLSVSVDSTSGEYSVSVGGKVWLKSGDYALNANGVWHSSASGGSLSMESHTTYNGRDAWGPFSATQLTWRAGGAQGPRMVTTFREYSAVQAIAFEQAFPDGAEGTSVWDSDKVATVPLRYGGLVAFAMDANFGFSAPGAVLVPSLHDGG